MTRPAIILATALLPAAAAGDVLVLDDGTELVGEAERDGDGYVVTDAQGNVTRVDADRVRRFVFGRDSLDPGAGANDTRLENLRRGAAGLDDLDQIVARYEAFVGRLEPGDPLLAEARDELGDWRRRRGAGMVKLGDEWLAPADRDARLAAALGVVNEARLRVKSGGDDATAAATALLDDPVTAAAGEYLLGVLAHRDGRLAEARSRFQAARAARPGHAPSLVNLAAIEAELGRADRASWFMAEAVEAAPQRAEVLDNAAELIELLGDRDDRDDRNARRLRASFGRFEAELRREMADRGLYRFGSGWVDAARQAELEAARTEVEAAVSVLKKEYDALAAEEAVLAEKMAANARYLRQLADASTARAPDGTVVRVPPPPEYHAAERDNELLAIDRRRLAERMADLERRAAAERAELPAPPFAGRLAPVGEDGVPVLLPPESLEASDPPSTRPG